MAMYHNRPVILQEEITDRFLCKRLPREFSVRSLTTFSSKCVSTSQFVHLSNVPVGNSKSPMTSQVTLPSSHYGNEFPLHIFLMLAGSHERDISREDQTEPPPSHSVRHQAQKHLHLVLGPRSQLPGSLKTSGLFFLSHG